MQQPIVTQRSVVCLSACLSLRQNYKKDCPYSITERRVPELILVLGSQPAGDES